MKIAIVGAGSPYSPEIVKELSGKRGIIPVTEIVLNDINLERLDIITGFLRRYASTTLHMDVKITAEPDLQKALEGASFVITQYRVGGNAARVRDERIPLRHGFIGQETTGAGGMMKALRTIPVAVGIAKVMEQVCPEAWMINYTNPSGMIAEGLSKYSKIRSVGLCAGGIRPAQEVSKVTGAPESSIRYDFFGLNHLNFAYNITIGGKPLPEETLREVLKSRHHEATERFVNALGVFPISYIQYYFRTQKKYNEINTAPQTRGERVLDLEKTIYDAYANPKCVDEPAELSLRGGGGYSQVAIGVLEAIYANVDRWMVCNVPNQGTVRFLPDDAVIETGCIVNAAGIKPLPQPHIPKQVWGLVSAVKNYEQLAVEAAMTGDRDLALAALVAHPLVGDVDRAVPLLDELLEANREYLPNFFS